MASPDLAAQAFIFGYPLVADLTEFKRFSDQGMGSLAPSPLNRFGHATTLAGAGDFRPALRMHQPGDALFDGSYDLPSIVRTS